MHSLVWKQLEMPKEMDKDRQGKEDTNGDNGNVTNTDMIDYLEPRTLLRDITPCLSSHNPHSSSCSNGIQALVNNVHHGYVSFDEEQEDDDPGQSTEEEEESQISRQWRRKKKLELQARQRESLAKQDRILEQAAIERENFYKEREAQIEAKKRLNRESETKYRAHVESQHKLVEGNLWEAVAALIDLNGEIDRKAANRSPKSSIVELSTPKKALEPKKLRDSPKPVKKTTDLSRMREILLKLQHQPLVRGGDMIT